MEKSSNIKLQLHQFYLWWITGLLYLLPASVRRMFDAEKDVLTIEFDNSLFIFKYSPAVSDSPKQEYSCHTNCDEIEKTTCLAWLNEKLTDNTQIQLLIPQNKVLHQQITLPKATEQNLRQVLEFEMDRRTPFTVDQVYFDFTVLRKDAEHLTVDLYVTPRIPVDEQLELLKSFNLIPHAVKITDTSTTAAKLNLLPADKRPQNNNHSNRSILALGTTALILLLLVLYVPIAKQYQLIGDLEKQIDDHRELAMQAKSLEEKRDKLLFNSQFLSEKKQGYLPVIDLLNELTNILPDNTWVSRFMLTNGEIQIQGESDAASSIIELLETSKYFRSGRFVSPVTRNEQTQKDKYNISAKITGIKNEIARAE